MIDILSIKYELLHLYNPMRLLLRLSPPYPVLGRFYNLPKVTQLTTGGIGTPTQIIRLYLTYKISFNTELVSVFLTVKQFLVNNIKRRGHYVSLTHK